MFSEKYLLAAIDAQNAIDNMMVPINLDYQKIIYLYRSEISQNIKETICMILNKIHKNVVFKRINSLYEVEEILDKYPNITIDISANKYLNLYLFEKAIKGKNKILYFDNIDNVIKDYRTHTIIKDKIKALSIKEIMALKYANFNSNMHDLPKVDDKDFVMKFNHIMNYAKDKYKAFVSFISRIISIVSRSKTYIYNISNEEINYLKTNQFFKVFNDVNILKIEQKQLIISDIKFKALLQNAGMWLETYLYIILVNSKEFDEVRMSSIIEFDREVKEYPVTCEIDVMVAKDNKMIFISCKSNKVDQSALNEICLHNYVFGNKRSHAMIATFEDLNCHNPSIYEKAKELGVSILDVPRLNNKHEILRCVKSVLNNDYKYERVG